MATNGTDLEASTFQKRPCYRYIRKADKVPALGASEPSPNDILTVEQAAAETGIAPRRLRTACQRGELRARKVGKAWAIVRRDLEAWLDGRRKWLIQRLHEKGTTVGVGLSVSPPGEAVAELERMLREAEPCRTSTT